MRGIKTQGRNALVEGAVPMATVFMSFAQHMAFHAYGGYELGRARQDVLEGRKPPNPVAGYTMKIWIITLLLAGYEGLPGAENLLDMLQVLWRKLFKTDVRKELREFVQSIGGDPVTWSRGMSHDIAGFDLSRSVGLGRLVPGTDTISKTSTDVQRQMGGIVFDMMGPTGGLIEWAMNTAFDNKPIEESYKRIPGAIGNVASAYAWGQDGVRSPTGALITRDLETGELRDLTTLEVFGKALGFNPTVISQNRELLFEQHDARMYWFARRDRVLDDLWKATVQGDREAIADSRKGVAAFNEAIPESFRGQMRITPKEIADSRKARMRGMQLEEAGQPPSKRYRKLYEGIRSSFDEP